jgi:hypothetical protein
MMRLNRLDHGQQWALGTERWTNIGPAPILQGQTDPPSPTTGRVADIAVDPGDFDHWLIGAAQGGIWETRDAGTTWTARTDDQVFDPRNANILWVTLSDFSNPHVCKTENALSGSPAWFDVSPPVSIPHNTIVLNPLNPKIVYVGTDLGVWKTIDGGRQWIHMGPDRGLPNVAVPGHPLYHHVSERRRRRHGSVGNNGDGCGHDPAHNHQHHPHTQYSPDIDSSADAGPTECLGDGWLRTD